MPIQLLPVGSPTTLVANQVYALPAVKCTLFTDAASPTITQSSTEAFTASTAVALTGGSAVVVGPFLKATTAISITLKRD